MGIQRMIYPCLMKGVNMDLMLVVLGILAVAGIIVFLVFRSAMQDIDNDY